MYDLSCMLRLVGSMRLGNKRTFIKTPMTMWRKQGSNKQIMCQLPPARVISRLILILHLAHQFLSANSAVFTDIEGAFSREVATPVSVMIVRHGSHYRI